MGVLSAAEVFCDAMQDFDPALLSGADCVRVVHILARVEKVAASGRARAAFRAAECGSHGGRGVSDAPAWLARQIGVSNHQAREELAAVAAVGACPQVKEAVVAGSLSWAQAGEIAHTEQAHPGSAGPLLEVAATESLAVLREQARAMRVRAVDPDELYRQQRAARFHRHWRDELGMVRYSGAMLPEHGVAAMNRLDAETDRQFRAAHHDGRREPRDAYAADAFAAMLNGAPAKGRAKRRADVVYVVDLNAYRRGTVQAGEVCHIVGGGPIPLDIVKAIAQDAFVKVVLHDGVNINTVKHFGRSITAELRTALDLGPPPTFDGLTCIDCGNRFRIEDDHDNPIANNGETSLENVKGRCPACHRAKTERDRAAGLLNRKRDPPKAAR